MHRICSFHELVHLIYPNHSKQFYNYLALYMTDWEKRKEILGESLIFSPSRTSCNYY